MLINREQITNQFFFVALQLPLGRTSVMHLVPRETLPEPNSQGKSAFTFFLNLLASTIIFKILKVSDSYLNIVLTYNNLIHFHPDQRQKSKERSSGCCSSSCSIL